MSGVNNEVCHWTTYYAKSWREHQKLVRYLTDRARRGPILKCGETKTMVVQGRRQLRRYLRSRFGTDIPPGRSPRITAPERAPRTEGKHIKFGEALREYMLLCLAEDVISTAIARQIAVPMPR
jgi:hypothetical protein